MLSSHCVRADGAALGVLNAEIAVRRRQMESKERGKISDEEYFP